MKILKKLAIASIIMLIVGFAHNTNISDKDLSKIKVNKTSKKDIIKSLAHPYQKWVAKM